MIKSFAEYVDEHTLIELIIKERVKSAAKKTVEKKEKQRKGRKKQDKKEKEQKDICHELHNLTPPRNTWRRLRKKTRNGISSTAVLNKLALRNTIRYDLEQVREHGAEAPAYLVNLLQFIEKIKAIVNSDKPIDFTPIGHHCPMPHCYNGHAWLTLGCIPELNCITYAQLRNRVCADGSEWLKPNVKNFFSCKLKDNNREYSWLEKAFHTLRYCPSIRKLKSYLRK